MSHFSAHSFYCDDVRQELGGKVSLMGIYRGALTFDGPAEASNLVKLVACTFIEFSKDDVGKPLDIWVSNMGKPHGPRLTIKTNADAIAPNGKGYLLVPVEFVPMELRGGMALQVHVRLEGRPPYDSEVLDIVHTAKPV